MASAHARFHAFIANTVMVIIPEISLKIVKEQYIQVFYADKMLLTVVHFLH